MMTEPAHIQVADDREYALIRKAAEAANSGNWVVGECAAEWLAQYGRGKTDGEFGELIGLTEDQVWQRRKVWERFGQMHTRWPRLTWTHFRAALGWPDAEHVLEWAATAEATIRQMEAYRNTQRRPDKPTGRVPAPVNGNTGGTEPGASTPAKTGKAETAGKPLPRTTPVAAKKPAAAPVPERVAAAPEAAATPQPEAVQELSSKSLTTALEQVRGLIEFIMDNGQPQDRAALAELLAEASELCAYRLQPAQQQLPGTVTQAQVIVDEWNHIDGVIRCRAVTEKIRRAIAARLKEQHWRTDWRAAIDKVRVLTCLHGDNARKWKADLQWFLRPGTVPSLLEGKYDTWQASTTAGGSTASRRLANNAAALDEVFDALTGSEE